MFHSKGTKGKKISGTPAEPLASKRLIHHAPTLLEDPEILKI
jgi:hypothetical protein